MKIERQATAIAEEANIAAGEERRGERGKRC